MEQRVDVDKREADKAEWYVRYDRRNVFGPFAVSRRRELVKARQIKNARKKCTRKLLTEIRQGLSGKWKICAGGTLSDSDEEFGQPSSAQTAKYSSHLDQMNKANRLRQARREEEKRKNQKGRRNAAGVLSRWAKVDERHILPFTTSKLT